MVETTGSGKRIIPDTLTYIRMHVPPSASARGKLRDPGNLVSEAPDGDIGHHLKCLASVELHDVKTVETTRRDDGNYLSLVKTSGDSQYTFITNAEGEVQYFW